MSTSLKARRKRLLVLADWLEHKVQPMLNGAKFDISVWGSIGDDNGDYPTAVSSLAQAKECGFIGCAIGWGALCPQLRGLRRMGDNNDGFTSSALGDYFGISDVTAGHMFSHFGYRSGFNVQIPEVVTRLREIAAE